MTKIGLKKFIEENEPLLVVFGIFLAVVSLSFNEIKHINEDYAGYLAIFLMIIFILISIELFREGENLDNFANTFLASVFWIGTIILLAISKIFGKQIT